VTINMLLGGGVWQGAGVEGAWRPPRPPSEATSLAIADSRSAAAAFFARMDVRRRQWRAAMLSRWRLREQMLDGATRGGGRATRSVVVATEDDDNVWDLPPPPARWRGCGDAAVLSDRQRRRLRRGRGTTRRDERGGGNDKGQASGDDSPSRRDAAELKALWRCERSGDI
jgi:hypothetical protein